MIPRTDDEAANLAFVARLQAALTGAHVVNLQTVRRQAKALSVLGDDTHPQHALIADACDCAIALDGADDCPVNGIPRP